jgi:hypothetical protein
MKLSFRLSVCALLMVALLSSSGCGRKGKVVVTVNKEPVERQMFLRRLEQMYGQTVLRGIITEDLTLQYAEKHKLMPSKSEVDAEYADRKKEIEKETKKDWQQLLKERDQSEEELKRAVEYYLAEFNIRTKGVKATDKEVKQFYDYAVANKRPPYYEFEQIHLYHIQGIDDKTLEKAADMLRRGTPWDTVVRQMSVASDRNSGGDMGTALVEQGQIAFVDTRTGRAITPFTPEVAAKILKIGQNRWSEPIAVPSGNGRPPTWHIFRLTERKAQKTMSFKEAEKQARRDLMLAKAVTDKTAQKSLEDFLDFGRKAEIKSFDEKYTTVAK